jgi:hypothetical protein
VAFLDRPVGIHRRTQGTRGEALLVRPDAGGRVG